MTDTALNYPDNSGIPFCETKVAIGRWLAAPILGGPSKPE
jgi:hypothetical protein